MPTPATGARIALPSTEETLLSLEPGRSLSHYRLAQPIGQGGMGVVWRALDTTLGRDVAIKVLPEHFAHDAERMARFEREARLLASLNDPHIAAIYGLHTSDGVRFLAMELVEGQDLAERLQQGPFPVDEALRLALQVAQALEHAHEKGIIHRDLKPANVKLAANGAAKVLDFGLAKALAGETAEGAVPASLSQSPTLTGHLSGTVLLGTAAYMAPEQARGHAVDRRADIWAFGVLLFEMLTGTRLFAGDTITDTLASVLRNDPDWSLLPPSTPRSVRRLIQRCLERNPRRRLRDIGEARIALEDAIGGTAEEPTAAASGPVAAAQPARFARPWLTGAGVVLGLLLGLGAARFMALPRAPEVPLRRFHLATPKTGAASGVAISPDGRRVAFTSGDRVYVQGLDELKPRELASDPGAQQPFWSPDGAFVGYLTERRVVKVAIADGVKQTVCDTRQTFTSGCGATWLEDGTIVLSHAEANGMQSVSALGGDLRPLFALEADQETDFHQPSALPGNRGILFNAHTKSGIDNIELWAGGKRKRLLHLEGQTIGYAVYCPTGHILFERSPNNKGVWALPFSLAKLEATGDPFVVAPLGARPSVARDGTLVCLSGSDSRLIQLAWVDRNGKELQRIGPPTQASGLSPALAPDGVRVAYGSTEGDDTDIWIYDSARGTKTRLTFEPSRDEEVSWSPAGDRIYYQSRKANCSGLDCFVVLSRPADGSGKPDTLATSAIVPSVTPDGTRVLYSIFGEGGSWNLAMRAPSGPGLATTFLRSSTRDWGTAVSPDGRYVAYASDESGRWEIYLKRFPSGEGKWQISVAGGLYPHWNGKGDRLFYAQGNDILEVEVQTAGAPVLSTPRTLFARAPLPMVLTLGLDPGFDVTRDGERFVVMLPVGEATQAEGPLVVQNWFGEFRAKRP